jgi:hypothetical protein
MKDLSASIMNGIKVIKSDLVKDGQMFFVKEALQYFKEFKPTILVPLCCKCLVRYWWDTGENNARLDDENCSGCSYGKHISYRFDYGVNHTVDAYKFSFQNIISKK